MLFNSYEFVFLFLPIVLLLFYTTGSKGYNRISILWLVAASLFFYAWWKPIYFWLISASILFNFSTGVGLRNLYQSSKGYLLLVAGIGFNVSLLGFFKYANFFVDNVNVITGSTYHLETIILPLAISFFTFQQITYLVDVFKDNSTKCNFLNYCLFITFFPQLIAGPIVYHKEMLPQFAKNLMGKINHEHLAVGLTIFFIGLFKKVVFADGIEIYATTVFDAAKQGATLSFFEAWGGAFAYTFQLYFDFSGYSDMAIGLARMFGLYLPLNFHSPYKAVNIIEFWKRWHITLSRFLRDYLYIPLGGNRKTKFRRYLNLMITMILGGLWHGAGWTFVIWGALHGFYIVINHVWRSIRSAIGHDLDRSNWLGRKLSQFITFLAVVVAWVFFRAENLEESIAILKGMAGMNGFFLPEIYMVYLNKIAGAGDFLANLGLQFMHLEYFDTKKETVSLFSLLLIIWYAPNTYQFMLRYQPALDIYKGKMLSGKSIFVFSFTVGWAFIIATIAVYSLINVSKAGAFLYFNF